MLKDSRVPLVLLYSFCVKGELLNDSVSWNVFVIEKNILRFLCLCVYLLGDEENTGFLQEESNVNHRSSQLNGGCQV